MPDKNRKKLIYLGHRLFKSLINLSIQPFYLIALHLLLLLLITQTNFITLVKNKLGIEKTKPLFLHTMRTFHYRMDTSIPEHATIFLGDSLTQGLATAAIAPYSVNYGIGNQTVGQLLESVQSYHSLRKAKIIFVAIGTNDLNQGLKENWATKYRQLLALLPSDVPLVWSSIMPMRHPKVSPQEIAEANQVIKTLCNERRHCIYIDTWQFLTDTHGQSLQHYFLADGIHLNAKGYRLWIKALKEAAQNIPG